MNTVLKTVVKVITTTSALAAIVSTSRAGTLIGPGQDDFDRQTGQFTDGARRLDYEFFRPPGYSTGSSLPLVVFLHGFSDGQSFKQSRLNDTMRNLVHATQRDNGGRRLSDPALAERFDDDYAAHLLVPKIPIVDGWSSYLPLVKGLMDDLGSQYHIDPQRTYVTGFSNGGFATPTIIRQYPGLFAAGVPISGGGTRSAANVEALKNVPLWFFHGMSDSTVNPSNSINLANALQAAGGDTQLTLVPGGHNAGYEFAFRDAGNEFYPWLFSQSLPVPEPSSCLLAAWAMCATVLRVRPA
jgi:predicted peptidase